MNKHQKYLRPMIIGWAEVLGSYDVGEVRQYAPEDANGIRGAISRTVKYKSPEMEFTTWFDEDKGKRVFRVKRLQDNSVDSQKTA